MKGYYDIQGDGGSDVLGQVHDQRSRIDGRLARVRHLVAVGSGKGGVGKSTLTLQLAYALAHRGLRVAILDADLNGPSQARLAGLGAVPLVPGANGLALPRNAAGIGVLSIGSMVPDGRALEFDSVARGDSYVWRATKEVSLLRDLLGGVDWGVLDLLLVDLPPGAERTAQYAEFLGARASLLLVTLPSDLSRAIVARGLAALAGAPNRLLGWVENMSGYCCGGCGEVRPLFARSDRIDLGLPCLGAVPFDPGLALAGDRGEPPPADRSGPALRAVDALAANLLEALEAP